MSFRCRLKAKRGIELKASFTETGSAILTAGATWRKARLPEIVNMPHLEKAERLPQPMLPGGDYEGFRGSRSNKDTERSSSVLRASAARF